METFSQKIKDSRIISGLSQRELADRVGVLQQTISNWETGKTSPTVKKLTLLIKVFGIGDSRIHTYFSGDNGEKD